MSQSFSSPTMLVILDGFGHSATKTFHHFVEHNMPTVSYLLKTYPHTFLDASGTAVGLMPNTMGNSEVGHWTIGTGRIQPHIDIIMRRAISDGTFFEHPLLRTCLQRLAATAGRLHLIGLVSDGHVHSSMEHIFAYLSVAQQQFGNTLFVHAILDGRDTDPQSAPHYLEQVQTQMSQLNRGTFGSLHGRWYAMDRDQHWDRTNTSYRVLTEPQPIQFDAWQQALEYYYQQQIYDEYIPPTQLQQESVIRAGDGVIFFNFRPDRARQLTSLVCKLPLAFTLSSVAYDQRQRCPTPLYTVPVVHNTLNDVLAHANKSIFAIAETEKYAHITYFFNGGTETSHAHETRVLIPSLPTKNYIDHPVMSAREITQAVLESLQNNPCDFYLINYANADMVGHSGDSSAIAQALKCLDAQLKELYDVVIQQMNGTLYITGDHGNAEEKLDANSHQKTEHTTNQVYFIMAQQKLSHQKLPCTMTGLSDIAPCILQCMGIPVPSEMK